MSLSDMRRITVFMQLIHSRRGKLRTSALPGTRFQRVLGALAVAVVTRVRGSFAECWDTVVPDLFRDSSQPSEVSCW